MNLTIRYLKMEYWLKKSYFDPVEVYAAGETKETRRQKLASMISSYVRLSPRNTRLICSHVDLGCSSFPPPHASPAGIDL